MNLKKYWLVPIVLILGMVIWQGAKASDSDSDDDLSIGDTSITDIDTTMGGNDVLAVGVGSLGAAAAQGRCVVTKQFALFIIFKTQGAALDKWCAAQDMDQAGKYEQAAILRCTIPGFPEMYGGEECSDAMNFGPVIPPPGLTDLYVQQEQEMEVMKVELAIVQTQVQRQQVAPRPQPVQQKPVYSDKQRKAIEEIFKNEMGKD